MKVKMLILAALLVGTGIIDAQGPESVPTLGRATSKGLYPAAISFDRHWTARGFNIEDAHRNIVFTWDDDGTISRESMTTCWSPDSAHVVFLDHQWLGPEFHCAELKNGAWRNVPVHLYPKYGRKVTDPKVPDFSLASHGEILDWVSPTMLQIKMHVDYDDPKSHSQKAVDYLTTLEFRNGEAFLAP